VATDVRLASVTIDCPRRPASLSNAAATAPSGATLWTASSYGGTCASPG